MSATDILARYAADVDRWHSEAVTLRYGACYVDPQALAEFDESWQAAARLELEELI